MRHHKFLLIIILIISLIIFIATLALLHCDAPAPASVTTNNPLPSDASTAYSNNAKTSSADITPAATLTDDTIIDTKETTTMDITSEFYITEITEELFNTIKGKSYKDNCTVPLDDLRYLHVLHVDFDGNTNEGEIICNKIIADDLLDIFRILYDSGYEIEKIRLIDEYDADDELSMSDNNSSCFNFRFISHSTTVSNHGYGLAIDINPLYNPYIKTVNGKLNIEPANSIDYIDRSIDFEHKIDENDLCYKLFIEHGFSWGGAWTSSKDYQHFEYNIK